MIKLMPKDDGNDVQICMSDWDRAAGATCGAEVRGRGGVSLGWGGQQELLTGTFIRLTWFDNNVNNSDDHVGNIMMMFTEMTMMAARADHEVMQSRKD